MDATCVTMRQLCRFQAVLSAKGGSSVFKIVETNDFKQLPHITLAFRPGNDVAVKQVMITNVMYTVALVASACGHLAQSACNDKQT